MKLSVGVGCALTLLPIVAFTFEAAGVIPSHGGHGLGEWFFDGACFVLLLVATSFNAVLGRRGARVPLAMALVGTAGMIAFVAHYGIPFRS